MISAPSFQSRFQFTLFHESEGINSTTVQIEYADGTRFSASDCDDEVQISLEYEMTVEVQMYYEAAIPVDGGFILATGHQSKKGTIGKKELTPFAVFGSYD